MQQVSTVTGLVPPQALGAVLPAEHLRADHSVPEDLATSWARVGRRRPIAASERARYEARLTMGILGDVNLGALNRDNERLDDTAQIAGELRRFREFGGGTVVDTTTIDAGRAPRELRRLAGLTGLRVVMSTGWRSERWAPQLAERDAETIAAEMVEELTIGVTDPGVEPPIRAGLIAQHTPLDPADPADERLLRAHASAAARTGAPILIRHPREAASAFPLAGLLLGLGIEPQQLALSGVARFARDHAHLRRLAELGVGLCFDGVGRIPTVYTRVSDHETGVALIALDETGHRAQLLVSSRVRRKIELTAFGGTGYAFVQEQLLPYLAGLGGAGADPAFAAALTVDNPARFLARWEA